MTLSNMLLLPPIRDVDLDNRVEYEANKFYWERGLSRVAGVLGWDEQERHYCMISRARWPHADGGDIRMFNPSTEAFYQLLWENNYDRWCAQIQWMRDHPGEKLPTRTSANKNQPMFKGLYTNQDGGQQRMGGWTMAGIERYNAIYDLIVNAKYKNPENPVDRNGIKSNWSTIESNFLQRLRAELGIEAENAQQERNNRRRRNNPDQQEPERRVRPRGIMF